MYRHNMPIADKVRYLLEKYSQRWDCKGNDAVIVGRVRAVQEKEEEKTISEILKIIDALAGELDEKGNRKIVYAPIVSQALEGAKAEHAHYNYNSFALENMVLDKTESLGEEFSIKRKEDISDVMDWFEQNEDIPLSAYGQQQRQQAQQAKHNAELRLKLLTSILQGRKSTYPAWSPEHAQIRYIDACSLENKSNEELAQIERDVTDLRRRQSGSREDQRQELQREADSHKDYKHYRPGDRDTFDTDAVPSRYSEDSKPAISVRTEARHGETDRAVSQVGTAATPVDPFISKATGREFTKAEAYALSRKDVSTFRILMRKDVNRLNRILGN